MMVLRCVSPMITSSCTPHQAALTELRRGLKSGCKLNGRSIKSMLRQSPNNGRKLLWRGQRPAMCWLSLNLILISQTRPCPICRLSKATLLAIPSVFIALVFRVNFLMKWQHPPISAKACGTPSWKQAMSLASRLTAPKRCMCFALKKAISWLAMKQTARPHR